MYKVSSLVVSIQGLHTLLSALDCASMCPSTNINETHRIGDDLVYVSVHVQVSVRCPAVKPESCVTEVKVEQAQTDVILRHCHQKPSLRLTKGIAVSRRC